MFASVHVRYEMFPRHLSGAFQKAMECICFQFRIEVRAKGINIVISSIQVVVKVMASDEITWGASVVREQI